MKIGVEAHVGSQEEVRLEFFHPKEECDVWLLRAQGSFITTRVTSKEARLCGSARDGTTWDDERCRLCAIPGGGRDEGCRPRRIS